MCTLIVLHRCVAGRPLVVAANRDEFFDRPAEEMALRTSRTGPILSPLDLEAGGTWLGLNQRGVFAGLTNLRPVASESLPESSESKGRLQPEQCLQEGSRVAQTGDDSTAPLVADPKGPNLKSRGDVVMAALEAESASEAVRSLLKSLNLEEAAYNPFQLLVADGRDAWLIVYRDRPRAIELEPGPHIVGNVEDERIAALLGTPDAVQNGASEHAAGGFKEDFAGDKSGHSSGHTRAGGPTDSVEPRTLKLTRIRERVEKMVTEPGIDLFEGLARICREHIEIGKREFGKRDRDPDPKNDQDEDPGRADEGIQSPLEATCVHIADRYGTRSSFLLELSENPDASRMWTTDGPPCEQPFENRSSLLKDLGVRLSS